MAVTGDVVVGVFRDRMQAQQAIEALKNAGFAANDISMLMQDRDRTRAMAEDTGANAGTGAATGAVAGGVLGGLAGWLVGIGAIAIPGVGPFIAAGALATALGGAAAGGEGAEGEGERGCAPAWRRPAPGGAARCWSSLTACATLPPGASATKPQGGVRCRRLSIVTWPSSWCA